MPAAVLWCKEEGGRWGGRQCGQQGECGVRHGVVIGGCGGTS